MYFDPSKKRKESFLSVVVPLYNEQENLPELYRRLVKALEIEGCRFELVLVNDGSRDETPQILAALQARDARIVNITLSRNFGHQAAICAGIDHARGEAVILMDGDLQDPPEVLPQFIATWRQGHDVVYAIRTKRKESWIKRCCYALFYRVFHAVSNLDIPLDSGDFCLIDRKVIEILKQLPERNRFVRGLRTFVGFKQIGLAYERAARLAGKPKYTFIGLCRLALDGVINFSSVPLGLLTYAGVLCLTCALLGGVLTGFLLLQQDAVAGWWLAMLVIVGSTGLQLLGLGILGEYIQRIFWEIKARPTYIVGALAQASVASAPPPQTSFPEQAA